VEGRANLLDEFHEEKNWISVLKFRPCPKSAAHARGGRREGGGFAGEMQHGKKKRR